MFYIIPSWNESSMEIDLNFTLNRIKTLDEENAPYLIMVEDFYPMINQQLEKFGLINSNIWRVYDEIQGVNLDVGRALTIEDIPLLNGVEQVYSPSGVYFLKSGKTIGYATMFAGLVLEKITYFNFFKDINNNDIDHIDYFDSRGFMSRRYFFKNNVVDEMQLFNTSGDVVLSVNYDGEVIIHQGTFLKARYSSLKEVAFEVTKKFLFNTDKNDRVLSPITSEKIDLMEYIQNEAPACGIVDDSTTIEELKEFVTRLDRPKLIVPSDSYLDSVNNIINDMHVSNVNVKRISPYATTYTFGESNSIADQIIFWYVGETEVEKLIKVSNIMFHSVDESVDEKLLINVSDEQRLKIVKCELESYIKKQYKTLCNSAEFKWMISYLKAKDKHSLDASTKKEMEKKKKSKNWNNLVKAGEFFNKLYFSDKNKIAFFDYCLNKTRLLVDLSEHPLTYLQVRAISYGVPQINVVPTVFVSDQVNGMILSDVLSLGLGINFFLNSLTNWNISLVENTKKMKRFSSQKIVEEMTKFLN